MRDLGRERSYFFPPPPHAPYRASLIYNLFCFVLFIFVLQFFMHLACFIFASLLSRPGAQASLFAALLTLCMEIACPFLRLCRRNEIGDYGTTFEPLRGDHGHNVKLKTILTKVYVKDWIF